MTEKKKTFFGVRCGYGNFKRLGREEDYKNLDRSSCTRLSKRVVKGPCHLKELKLEVANDTFSDHGSWKKHNVEFHSPHERSECCLAPPPSKI